MKDPWKKMPPITKTVQQGRHLDYHVVVNPEFELWLNGLKKYYEERCVGCEIPCDGCDKLDSSEAYEHVMDNPPDPMWMNSYMKKWMIE